MIGCLDSLAATKLKTKKEYINEILRKYRRGTKIADVPTQRKGSGHPNEGLAGQALSTDSVMILEVPVQKNKVPKEILDYAKERGIVIRDEQGRVLNSK